MDNQHLLPPVIDLKTDTKDVILSKLRHALKLHGFFVVCNHSIPASVIDNTRATLKHFFALNQTEKERFTLHTADHVVYGYAPPGREKSDVANLSLTGNDPTLAVAPRDLMESFNFHISSSADVYPPAVGAQMKAAHEAFVAQLDSLLVLVEAALEVEEGFLTQTHQWNKPHRTLMRCTHYPALHDFGLHFDGNPENQDRTLRIGEHKDLGTLTLLALDNQGGLQVRVEEGGSSVYVDVPNFPGALVVNSGLCLMRLW